MKRDGENQSFWESQVREHNNPVEGPLQADAIVVGAGITGISTALELQSRGKSVIILEKDEVGFGTTGGTTAHINNFFDASYDEVISDFGEDQAKVLAKAAKDAVRYIRQNIDRHQISCEYAECDFYLFSAEEKQNKKLDDILEAQQKVGIDTRVVHEIPFPLHFEKAIEIKGQAQFHPLKYINALVKAFGKIGGRLLTNSAVAETENENGSITVKTRDGNTFSTKNLVWATHVPPGANRFSILVAPYRSYALAAKLENPPKHAAQTADLYDPYHYMRYHKSEDEWYLIAGGFDHKTGHEEEPEKCFEDLEEYVEKNFRIKNISHRWSSQYYVPADGLPYIGKMPGEENTYIATGYNGNGMTFGTMAATIIPDLIEGKETELSKLFSPARVKPAASAKSVIQEGADAALHFVKDKLSSEKIQDYNEIGNGDGKLVKKDGKTVAAYRDEKGGLHLLNPVCPHAGCNVSWNATEKSWDCPCHGSRFDVEGRLLNGPAMMDLEKI